MKPGEREGEVARAGLHLPPATVTMSSAPIQMKTAAGPQKHPLVEMLALAAPTVATMASFTVMQFADKFMVSRVGPDPVYIAAQSNGSLASFVPIAAVMGLLTIINTYVSQNLGAGKPERGPAYAWAGIWLALGAWIVLLPYGAAMPWLFAHVPEMLSGSPHDPRLVELEAAYGRILVFGAFLTLASRGISQYFYGMHKPMTVLLAALVGNTVNVLMNLLLIYGPAARPEFGEIGRAAAGTAGALRIPELGVAGAAYATLIGLVVELSIPLGVFLGPRLNRLYRTRAAWRPEPKILKDIARLGWPGGLMFGNEMLCWGYFTVILVGTFGEVHQAAGYIALQYMHLSFMPAVGISVAVTALVGRCMGMRRPDLAAKRAWLGLAVNTAYMGLCGVAFVLFREQMIGLFVPEGTPPEKLEQLLRIGGWVMIAAAAFQIFDALAITASAALRGAGDTVWPGVMTVIAAWVWIIGGGHALVAYAPQLESVGPWLGASAYIVFLGVALLWRFAAGRWKRLDLVSPAAAARESRQAQEEPGADVEASQAQPAAPAVTAASNPGST